MTQTQVPSTASRRSVLSAAAGLAAASALGVPAVIRAGQAVAEEKGRVMSTISTKDHASLFFKEWGSGRPVVFSHGWPLSADAWDDQLLFLSGRGFRAIAHDRRGHGRSDQTSAGNDMDTYADDLSAVLEALNLKNVVLVGHSSGGGEVVRYIGRHGTKRIAKLVLISAIPPLLLKTPTNPGGLPLSAFDDTRAGLLKDRAQFYRDISAPFYGANRPGSTVSPGVRDAFWLMSMQCGLKNAYDCVKAFSETDFTEDLKRIDVPTLIIHGADDQFVPIADTAMLTSKMVKGATLKVYPGAPHGLIITHKDQLNADLLAFIKA
jgi:non-heme chloroperoxidase